jgi:ribonuclease E
MPNKMLIDATHPEETRVVVLRGNRVEEFDFESANRKQLRGNIYLAKVTRVEPSLQAAFVEYGGNRHGFLAFSEIHPDYYQIPVADRQALIDEDERAQRAADDEADHRAGGRRGGRRERHAGRPRDEIKSEVTDAQSDDGASEAGPDMAQDAIFEDNAPDQITPSELTPGEPPPATHAAETPIELAQLESSSAAEPFPVAGDEAHAGDAMGGEHATAPAPEGSNQLTEISAGTGEEIESVGGSDAMEEVPERMLRPRRQYKIQEVIKRRQVMLVQVVKEERGSKGAALTTYLSLAGRYSVLMPNTARGGGISRKITDVQDRRRLKDLAQDLEVPEGMGVILRTAGASRTKTEIKRDFEYLLRLWETVRDLTLKSTAPTLVYEEGSLVKRSIRDLYNKDIDEILVAGDESYKDARDFMRMLMPSHAKNVKPFRDTLPIFTRFGIEGQLDAMFQPVVQLRSGGYIVINQAEALVAIDVNSGRATREHHIEDTALKTNLEAADEVARQLRLRDLAGLIVIDFIDMDEKRNNRTVERRMKEALRHDRARIQVGHISHFGLLEMSRQRIRSSVLESSTEKCPHCGGTGHVRSVSSVTLQLLRAIEEVLQKGATHNLVVRTRSEIALYLLNQKRAHLRVLEERFQIAILVTADASIGGQQSYIVEKGELVRTAEEAKALAAQPVTTAPLPIEEDDDFIEEEEVDEAEPEQAEIETSAPLEAPEDRDVSEQPRPDGERGRRRRRGRGRGRGREGRDPHDAAAGHGAEQAVSQNNIQDSIHDNIQDGMHDSAPVEAFEGERPEGARPGDLPHPTGEGRGEGEARRRRRGRRGGRRNRRGRENEGQPAASDVVAGAETELSVPESDSQPYAEPRFEQHEAEALRPRDEERAPQQPPQQQASPVPPAPVSERELRRRSTVREPAPIFGAETSTPATPAPRPELPAPIVSSTDEAAGQPRKAGWWSKRILGKG